MRGEKPATQSLTPLPSDWPSRFASYVKDEAAHYASAQRSDWPDSEALLQRSIDRVVKRIEQDTDTIDTAADEWVDRWESGKLDDEIRAAVDYYGSQALGALESNPALPPFEPVEVEQIRADMQAAIGAVAERYGLRVQYSELAPNEKTIPIGFKITRRAPEQKDLFGNPSRESNPRQSRISRRISST